MAALLFMFKAFLLLGALGLSGITCIIFIVCFFGRVGDAEWGTAHRLAVCTGVAWLAFIVGAFL